MSSWFSGLWNTLSARVRWLVLVATLPSVIMVIYQARAHRSESIAAAEHGAWQTLQSVSASQQRLIDSTRSFLIELSVMPQVQQPELPECGRFLAEVMLFNTNYVNLGVPLADGNLLCNASPLNSPVNVASRPYFQKTIKTRDFSVGSFQIDLAERLPSVNFAYPVIERQSQNVVGAVVAVVSLEWWSLKLSDLGLPVGAVARVLDADGRVMARYPPETRELGSIKNFAGAEFPNVLNGPPRTAATS